MRRVALGHGCKLLFCLSGAAGVTSAEFAVLRELSADFLTDVSFHRILGASGSASAPRVFAQACRSRSAACAISVNGSRFSGAAQRAWAVLNASEPISAARYAVVSS